MVDAEVDGPFVREDVPALGVCLLGQAALWDLHLDGRVHVPLGFPPLPVLSDSVVVVAGKWPPSRPTEACWSCTPCLQIETSS